MDFEDIERILELVRQHELVEFELERDGWKLRLRKAGATFQVLPPQMQPAAVPVTPVVAAPVATPIAAPPPVAEETALELAVVKSPIVGTFYRAAEPGAAPFVEVGQHVKKDEVLCIIEA